MARFWTALYAGKIVPSDWVEQLVRPRSNLDRSTGYGLGFWSFAGGTPVFAEGADHGVSFRSLHDPEQALTATIVSNTGDGAWAPARQVREQVFG